MSWDWAAGRYDPPQHRQDFYCSGLQNPPRQRTESRARRRKAPHKGTRADRQAPARLYGVREEHGVADQLLLKAVPAVVDDEVKAVIALRRKHPPQEARRGLVADVQH